MKKSVNSVRRNLEDYCYIFNSFYLKNPLKYVLLPSKKLCFRGSNSRRESLEWSAWLKHERRHDFYMRSVGWKASFRNPKTASFMSLMMTKIYAFLSTSLPSFSAYLMQCFFKIKLLTFFHRFLGAQKKCCTPLSLLLEGREDAVLR